MFLRPSPLFRDTPVQLTGGYWLQVPYDERRIHENGERKCSYQSWRKFWHLYLPHSGMSLSYLDFDGTVSQQCLRAYLSRAVTYANTLQFIPPEDDLRMLGEIGALFLGRSAYVWVPVMPEEEHFLRAREFTRRIHAMNPRIICQAAVFEAVYPAVNEIPIPTWVFGAFEETVETRNFRFDDMVSPEFTRFYTWGQFGGGNGVVPDLTRAETVRYFYYRACRYIDAGYEAIHLGQPHLYAGRDQGYAVFEQLCNRIRAHARQAARRHLVLLDAHTHGIARHGQLLLDFHSRPISARPWLAEPERILLHLKGTSLGGITPSGWSCPRLPYLIEVDNWGGYSLAPQEWSSLELRAKHGRWGWDDIAWFAHQPAADRDHFLRYAHYWLRVQDPMAFFQMPVRRLLGEAPVDYTDQDGRKQLTWQYRANRRSPVCRDGFDQEDTIRSVWAEAEPAWLADWHATESTALERRTAMTEDGQNVPEPVVLVGSLQTMLGGEAGQSGCPFSRMRSCGGGTFELATVIPWAGDHTLTLACGGTMTEVYRQHGLAGGLPHVIRTTQSPQHVRLRFDYGRRSFTAIDSLGKSLLV